MKTNDTVMLTVYNEHKSDVYTSLNIFSEYTTETA
jgi:hypothetical protein